MRTMTNEGVEDEKPPSLEELFVMAVSESLEVAQLLGMNYKQFVDTMKMAWHVDKQRREEEIKKQNKDVKKENDA